MHSGGKTSITVDPRQETNDVLGFREYDFTVLALDFGAADEFAFSQTILYLIFSLALISETFSHIFG